MVFLCVMESMRRYSKIWISKSARVEGGLIILEWKIEEEFKKHEFYSTFLRFIWSKTTFPLS